MRSRRGRVRLRVPKGRGRWRCPFCGKTFTPAYYGREHLERCHPEAVGWMDAATPLTAKGAKDAKGKRE